MRLPQQFIAQLKTQAGLELVRQYGLLALRKAFTSVKLQLVKTTRLKVAPKIKLTPMHQVDK